MKTDIDPAKLKVVELRAELSARGLDTKGNKAVLIDRLRDALSQETGEESGKVEEGLQQQGVIVNPPPVEESSHGMTHKKDKPEEEPDEEQAPEKDKPVQEKLVENKKSGREVVQPEKTPEIEVVAKKNLKDQQKEAEQEYDVHIKEEPMESEKMSSDIAVSESATHAVVVKEENAVQNTEIKKEPDQILTEVKPERRSTTRWSTPKEASNDMKATNQAEQAQTRGQKRQRSPSPEERSRSFREPPPRKPDDEPALDENAVLLGWYDSDLNLVISKDKGFLSATPLYDEGFAYVWAGARASHGITAGKVYFEARVIENCDISHLAEQEPNPNVLRVGWSTIENSMQLGEEPLSFGYGGTGKASTNCSFKDYGRSFGLGDVVTAYLDMDSNPARLSYSVNGEWQGNAYEIPKEKLGGKALFPHILSKNSGFECYFGSGMKQEDESGKPGGRKDSEPWVGADAGRADYVPLGYLEPHLRVPGPKRPEKREDCEAIMMMGLPACGKTTWAVEWAKKHPEKLYNILGTNSLIDKMKIMGLPRKRNYHGRWDVLIEKCTKCLVRLLAMAGNRRRNYIIDQTNVYPSAQRRKMKGFEGFIRRAVVIVPTDEEFKKRQAKQEKVEGKDVPESAVFEMKANFKIPEVGESFDEVIYVELGEQEAKQLVMQYNREAREAGYAPQGPPQKRFRGGGGGMATPNRDNRPISRREPVRGAPVHQHPGGNAAAGGRGGRGDYRGRGSNWTPRGNWRDNRPSYQAGSGSSGGSTYRGRGGNWRGGWGGGNYRGGYDRNRAGGSSGGGGRPQAAGGKGGWGGSWSGGGGNNSGGNWGGQSYGHGWGGQQGWKAYSPPSESGYASQSNYSQDSYGSGGHYASSESVYSADGQGSYSQGGYDGSANQQGGYGSQGCQSSGGYGSSASAGTTAPYSGADSGYGTTGTDWNQQYYQGYGNGSQSWNQGYAYGNQAPSGGSGFWQGSGTYGVAEGAAAGTTSGGYDYGAQGAAVGSGATGNGGYGK